MNIGVVVFFRDRKKPLVTSTPQAMTIQMTTADGQSKRYAYFITVCPKFKFHTFNFVSLSLSVTHSLAILLVDFIQPGFKFVTLRLFHTPHCIVLKLSA